MSTRKRPSGVGSNSRRFVKYPDSEGREIRVPVAKDAGTFVYICGRNGGWPSTPVVSLAYDAQWLVEGAVFEVVEMRPGQGMGTQRMVEVIDVRLRVSLHPGKWGQAQRLVLATPVEHDDDLAKLTAADFERRSLEVDRA